LTAFEQIKNKPVIICGIPKSGTTLLLALLDNHPQLTVFPEELVFFANVYGQDDPAEKFLTKSGFEKLRFRQIGLDSDMRDYSDVNFEEIEKEIHAICRTSNNFKDLLTSAIGIWHAVQNSQFDGKIRWVEKTPHNEQFVSLYNKWFKADAIYFHLIRDPRDNFATYRRKHPGFTLEKFVLRHALSHKIGEWAKQHVPNYYFIRYENLVTNPEHELRKISTLLGIQYSESLLEPTRNGKLWRGNSMYKTSFVGISSQPVGRYKDQLHKEEIEYLEDILREFLDKLGYKCEHSGPQKFPTMFLRKLKIWLLFLKWHVFKQIFKYPKVFYKIFMPLIHPRKTYRKYYQK